MNYSVTSKKIFLNLMVLTLFVRNIYTDKNETYLLLQEITRHGPRYPMVNVMNSTAFNNANEGELAPIGAASHFILGKNLQTKYSDFFDHYFGPEEIYIRSTGFNRTIQSAMAHVQGIFQDLAYKPLDFELNDWRVLPPGYQADPLFNIDELTFKSALPGGYYPYPVHTVPKSLSNDFFQTGETDCRSPIRQQIKDKIDNKFNKAQKNSVFYNTTITQMQKRFNISQGYIDGLYQDDKTMLFKKASYFADYFISMINVNKAFDFHHQTNYEDKILLVKMKILYYMDIINKFLDRDTNMSNTTPIIRFLKENVQKRLNNTSARKYYYLSMHDSNMMDILSSIRYGDPSCQFNFAVNYKVGDDHKLDNDIKGICGVKTPDPASSQMFELIKNNVTHKVFMRFNWDNEYINLCGLVGDDIPEKFDCGVETFYKLINDNMIDDAVYYEMCQNALDADQLIQANSKLMGLSYHIGANFAFIAIIVFVLILLVFAIIKLVCRAITKKKKRSELMRHSEDNYISCHTN